VPVARNHRDFVALAVKSLCQHSAHVAGAASQNNVSRFKQVLFPSALLARR